MASAILRTFCSRARSSTFPSWHSYPGILSKRQFSTSQNRGMLSLSQLEQEVEQDSIDTVIVAFPDSYGRLMGKRYDAGFFLRDVVSSGTHACLYLLTVDMEMEPVEGYDFANWKSGYGDFHLLPDWNSLRRFSWLDKTACVICDVAPVSSSGDGEEDHNSAALVPIAPRSVLSAQLEGLAELGIDKVQAASELEYYLFEKSFREAAQGGYRDLLSSAAGYYSEDYHILQGTRSEPFHAAARRHLRDSGLRVETSKGETGVGQHELNVGYSDALAMADNHMVYKQCLKEVAEQRGYSLTFMAKPFTQQAGSSCHVHLSLTDAQGRNMFAGSGSCHGLQGTSPLFNHFLGGCIKYAHDIVPFLAPTVNSYKRFVAGSWAPVATAWGRDNRTAGFRVVGSGPSLRIECRLPGADANAYLAFAALVATGLAGIREGVEPPPMHRGDAYAATHLPPLPSTLGEAAAVFGDSAFVRRAFGAEVQKHFAHFYATEQRAYDAQVTDWERQRYFERI